MVDDLLDMKKIMTGVVVLERRPCDLADVVAGFLATFNEAGRFKQHTLSVDAPEPVWVNGDAMRLQQIVSNLLRNAVKYTPAGGSIHVSVRREEADDGGECAQCGGARHRGSFSLRVERVRSL